MDPSVTASVALQTTITVTMLKSQTISSQAQSTSSQSPEVSPTSAAGIAPARSGARKFDIDFVMPVFALIIGASVLLVLRH